MEGDPRKVEIFGSINCYFTTQYIQRCIINKVDYTFHDLNATKTPAHEFISLDNKDDELFVYIDEKRFYGGLREFDRLISKKKAG